MILLSHLGHALSFTAPNYRLFNSNLLAGAYEHVTPPVLIDEFRYAIHCSTVIFSHILWPPTNVTA